MVVEDSYEKLHLASRKGPRSAESTLNASAATTLTQASYLYMCNIAVIIMEYVSSASTTRIALLPCSSLRAVMFSEFEVHDSANS